MLDMESSPRLAVRRLVGRYAIQMATAADIRRENLSILVAREGTQAAFARKIGKDKNQVNQWLGRAGKRNISDAIAREIEAALRLPEGWLDQPQARVSEPAAAYGEPDKVARLERELEGVIGLLSILLVRLGHQAPAEGAAVALELRKYLAMPEYEGEALPELLRVLESAVPSFAPAARASRAVSGE